MLHLPRYEPVDWVAPGPGDVLFDVGAYVGWYAVRAARAVGPSGRVVAVEPDPHNAAQLEKTLSLNHLDNVCVVRNAAWSVTGPVGWHASHLPVWHRVEPVQGAATVEAITVDDLVAALHLSRVDWLKLDVEGGEVEVLRGAMRTLRDFRPVLFIEVHNTLPALRSLLEPLGYSVELASFDVPPEKHGWLRMRPA
ncbi:MAG: FkbM family methyltransferase [Thermoanaerobaculia bacterium]